jgi:hypothetical protein
MRARKLFGLALITAIALSTTACDEDVEEIDLDGRRRTTPSISFVEAIALVEGGPKRIALEADRDDPARIVRDLVIRDDLELFQFERLIGPLPSAAPLTGACQGVLSLGFEGVDVRFDANVTRFESDEVTVSCDEFVTRVERIISLGGPAWVVASREPGRFPQAAGDPTFFAQTLRVVGREEEDARPRLELNVGPGSLQDCSSVGAVTGTCVGALEVLGQTFAVVDGSDLDTEFPAELIVVDLDDFRVRSISADGRELLLENGITVRVLDATRYAEPDPSGGLRNLEEARAALAEGAGLRVEGAAMVLSGTPLALLADEIALLRTDAADRPADDVIVVEGDIGSVDLGARTLRLTNGTEVRITEDTELEGEIDDLGALAGAIEAGDTVRADVLGRSTTAGSAQVVEAVLVRSTRTSPADGGVIGPL